MPFLQIDQGTPEWLEARKGRITGSRFKDARDRSSGLTEQQTTFVALMRSGKTEADAAKADRMKTQVVLGEVKEQVANTHPTNLRDDIDNLTALVERLSVSQADMKAVVHRLDSTTEAIRGEARDERARVGRIEAEAHDTHNDLYRLIRDIKKEK